ncbi:hypothetical protein IIB79_08960 [candidate division KSB1 bacterium]|nr:hypothetical protein [candidate division KSB1 bacterium]
MAEATGHYMCLAVSEWLKESRFVGCTFTRTEGSNPSLSAKQDLWFKDGL